MKKHRLKSFTKYTHLRLLHVEVIFEAQPKTLANVFLDMGQIWASFVYFRSFLDTMTNVVQNLTITLDLNPGSQDGRSWRIPLKVAYVMKHRKVSCLGHTFQPTQSFFT